MITSLSHKESHSI